MHIMLIDDEKILSGQIQKKLEKNGYHVTVIKNYQHFTQQKNLKDIDLFLVDMSLGDGSGIDVVQSLKKGTHTQSTPIIFISGHGDVDKKVQGLDAGANDYIVKPFEYQELLARIRSNIRISRPKITSSKIKHHGLVFDTADRSVSNLGVAIILSKKEKQILEYFLTHVGECVSKNQLKKMFWKGKSGTFIAENTINVTICHLRKKIGTGIVIKTVRGEGYILQ